jgi:3-deoxy-alpha-D-manno-octulosonate 8-oxidase
VIKNSKNVQHYYFGNGSFAQLAEVLSAKRQTPADYAVFFVDECFQSRIALPPLPAGDKDVIVYVGTVDEPTTDDIDSLTAPLRQQRHLPCAVVGIGGGITLDTAKAVANLLTNEGQASDYQGWDLVKKPAVYKVGIPTLSGTGAEATRTCVMLNVARNLKLGMNSEHTVFDQLILDPQLTRTVPRDQYFYSGMDTYIHCVESLNGSYRNAIADSFSREALKLSKEVFESDDMMSDANREKIMVASYLGGSAVGNSFVGVIHPFSAGLSVVLDTHHCLANCIVMNVMDEFYPDDAPAFRGLLAKQKVPLPAGVCRNLSDEQYEKLYRSTVIH